MALTNAKPGTGSEATEIFTELMKHSATVVMRVVSHDGKKEGQNGAYDVVTAHVLVCDGPHAWEFHKSLVITNAGITGPLVRTAVGDDVAATIGSYKSFGKDNPAANECTPEKFAEVSALFSSGDPFSHYLGPQNATPTGAQTASVSSQNAISAPPWAGGGQGSQQTATAGPGKPPWAK